MKKLIPIFVISLLISLSNLTEAQNTCATPYLFETGSSYSYNLDTNVVNQDTSVFYDCLSSELNPIWFYFVTCTSGSMELQLSGLHLGSGLDVDYVVWGPLLTFDDCNLSASNVVDCSYAASSIETVTIPNLVPGVYKIMVTNYSNIAGTLDLAQTGGTGYTCNYVAESCHFPAHQICNVSNDLSINKNTLNWVKDTLFNGEFRIEKETATSGVFSTIGIVNSANPTIFTDTISNPIQQSYIYRLQSIDTCGEIKTSNIHRTMHLLSSINLTTNYPQLSWNNYIGFNYLTYYIYRGTSSSTLTIYDSISSSFNSYVDVNPIAGNLFYAIGINLPSTCTSSGALKVGSEVCYSNISPVNVVSVEEINNIVVNLFPNPTNDILNISFGLKTITGQINLTDIYGRIISSKNLINNNSDIIDVHDLPQGYYIISIKSDKLIGREIFVKTN